jgi:cell wall-associated NlpC family hydrolase
MQMIKKMLFAVPLFFLIIFSVSSISHAEDNKMGIVTCDVLNIRELPGTNHKILTQVSNGQKMKVTDSADGWHQVTYKDIVGWVNGDYVTVKIEPIGIGTINANDVNIRTEGNLSSSIITRLNKGVSLEVFSRQQEWYKIKLPDGKDGWVFEKYLTVREDSSASRGDTDDSRLASASLRSRVVEYAKQFLGVKYVYGGSSPKGFDCSGLVQYVFKNFGIKLERVAANQAKHGAKVDKANLAVGDLVFFDTNGGKNSIEHVGIFLGDGKFIHASSGRGANKVIISDLTSGYYSDTYMWARRYILE